MAVVGLNCKNWGALALSTCSTPQHPAPQPASAPPSMLSEDAARQFWPGTRLAALCGIGHRPFGACRGAGGTQTVLRFTLLQTA